MAAEQLHWAIKMTLPTAASTRCQQLFQAEPASRGGSGATSWSEQFLQSPEGQHLPLCPHAVSNGKANSLLLC